MQQDLLSYYKKEISELREEGLIFSKQYPDIAKKISFSNIESSDPHIERMLESFAFLSARIKRQNDVLMLDAARLLLECIYSDLLGVIPSIGLVKFCIDKDASLSFGHTLIKRGENIFINNDNGSKFQFITTCDTYISPIEIGKIEYIDGEDIQLDANKYIHLKLIWAGNENSDKKAKIKIYLTGAHKYDLWEKIIIMNNPVYFYENNEKLGSCKSVEVIGFNDDESLFVEKNSYPGYRILTEYMVFPEKFLGFSIDLNVDFKDEVDIYIPILDTFSKISKENLLFNVMPIINFFITSSDPVFFDTKVIDQIILVNSNNYIQDRVHKILSVKRIVPNTNIEEQIPNFFDINKNNFDNDSNIYWQQKKKFNSIGIENTYISFLNIDFSKPQLTSDDVFHANLICSNRKPYEFVNDFSDLTIEMALPIEKIKLIDNLSEEVNLNIENQHMWKLISFLSLNGISINEDKNLINIKRIISFFSEILQVKRLKENLPDSILDVKVNEKTKCVSKDCWRGFVKGYEILVNIDRNNCNSPILFGGVLEMLLSNFIHVDSFVEVNVMENGGVLKTWEMKNGCIQKI